MGGNESVEVTAGIWGFLVLFGLALACWFLFRSMNTHLRKVTFTEREQSTRGGADGVERADDDPIGSSQH